MRGQIRKRGATWAYVIEIGRHPVTGRRRQKWRSGFRTRKEAERALAEELARINHGDFVEPSTQTLGQYLADWCKGIAARVRASTFESYGRNLRVHVLPHLGEVRLQSPTAAHLNTLYAALLSSGRADGKGGLSARTVRYIHVILHRALRDAVRWNLLARNPANSADPPSPKATRVGLGLTRFGGHL